MFKREPVTDANGNEIIAGDHVQFVAEGAAKDRLGRVVSVWTSNPSISVRWNGMDNNRTIPASKVAVTNLHTRKTRAHIEEVRHRIGAIVSMLTLRARNHDQSKLVEPEASAFDRIDQTRTQHQYGSEGYKAMMVSEQPAIDHHYEMNDHHPEHFADGVYGMNLMQLCEMLADWKAASLRTDNPLPFMESMAYNKTRFNIDPTLYNILISTVVALGWDR